MSTVDEQTIADPFGIDFAVPSLERDRDAIIRGGRYRLPNRDGSHKKGGWQRVSNLVSAFSDQYGLRLWELGEVLTGVAVSPELYAALLDAAPQGMAREERRAWVERFIEQAKDASGGNYGSKHGIQRHAAVEAHHMGLPEGMHDSATRRDLSLYESVLERNRLVALPRMQERRVLVEELGAAGTLDNVLADASYDHFIADLKTQRRFWTWLEIGAQLACYAHGDAMWNAERECWEDMPPVSREVAMVLWMPRDQVGVQIWEVDIAAGWRTAQLAYAVVRERAAAKSVKTARAWLRPAPAATETERWAARFAACDSLAEGSRLVQEARAAGVWDETLAGAAQRASERLRIHP